MTKLQMKERWRRTRAKIAEYIEELEAVNPNTKMSNVVVGCSTVAARLRKILKEEEYETGL